jgi:hypothetical protein
MAGMVRAGMAAGTLIASSAGAWMPVAHYCIAKEAAQTTANAPAGVERYAGLPDYHENTDLIYLKMRVENTPEFCWSHGVISHDYSGDITLTFPNDGRAPEDALYSLLRDNLASARFADPVVKLAAMNTVNGFIAHNTADRVVHFTYFGHGSKDNWYYHHGLKEVYAEYYLLKRIAFNGADIVFDAGGNVHRSAFLAGTLLSGTDTYQGIPFATPATGTPVEVDTALDATARLMRLGQMVHRKNRRIWHETNDSRLEVATVSVLKGQLEEASQKQNEQGSKTYWQRTMWTDERMWTAFFGLLDVKKQTGTAADGTVYETKDDTPTSLQSEYDILLTWYRWARHCNPPGSVSYWDDNEIWSKYGASRDAVKGALKTVAELEPQG